MSIIGISGKSQSGKDAVGVIIQALKLWQDIHRKNNGHALKEFENVNQLIYHSLKGSQIFISHWTIRKFGSKLKRSMELKFPSLFNVDRWESEGSAYRDQFIGQLGMTRREWIIAEGHGLRQLVHPNYWVVALMSDYDSTGTYTKNSDGQILKYSPNWIITDLRYENELKSIIDRKGLCVRVVRNGVKLIDSVSETSLDSVVGRGLGLDDVIVNDGGIDDLIQSTRHWMTARGLIDE